MLTIPDELIAQTGMTPEEMRVEIACRLFAAGRITLLQASRFAQLGRLDMETALRARAIPMYDLTPEELQRDLDTLRSLRE